MHQAANSAIPRLALALTHSVGSAMAADTTGNTPLHIAAYYGHQQTVRDLLASHEYEVNCTNSEDETPLQACHTQAGPAHAAGHGNGSVTHI